MPRKDKASKAKYMREWYHRNAEKVKQYQRDFRKQGRARTNDLRCLYGIDEPTYNAILAEQGNVCKICRRPRADGEHRFHVDHDHQTGEVRGILCSQCNVGIGYFKNDPTRLRLAAEYIETFVPKQSRMKF